jgi:hypothetical protein
VTAGDARARLLAALDELAGLVMERDEHWANWLRSCRALIGRNDVRGLDRLLEGLTEAGGLTDLDLPGERVGELLAACHDDAAALRRA